MIIDLLEADDINLVGGKATSLSRLLRAKIRTPDGFVITTQTKFPLTSRSQHQILTKFDHTFPAGIKVAVRSSGVNEDSVDKSFAGQFDTFLHVEREDLIPKIEQVHASAFSQKIYHYDPTAKISIAVIIQTMITPNISGVAFSANPITGNRDELMLEATPGLGEKLVSGQVTPDLFIIDKSSGQILSHETGNHPLILTLKNLAKLIDQVRRIELLYGYPVDVEWAIANDQLFILQARPITVLK